MKFLIAGLGNIGDEYLNTRHNIGFLVLDELAKQLDAKFSSGRLASVAEAKHKGKTLLLIKPTTYMNLSGKAVNYWMQEEKISLLNLLVVTDDLALPFGTIRLRAKGNDGGHNGLKNIAEVLNSNQYARARFGIGNDFLKGKQVDYVLSDWTDEETRILPERINQTCELIKSFAAIGINFTMSNFNNK